MQKVYVIGPKDGPLKVGIARDPQDRLKSLQTGNPYKLELLFSMESDEASVVESTIHRALRHKRLTGEWFSEDLESVIDAITNYKDFLEGEGSAPLEEPVRLPMSADQFATAVIKLQDKGVIPPGHGWKTALANKLGVTRTTIDNFEKQGTRQVQTDYAIAALLAGLEPYS